MRDTESHYVDLVRRSAPPRVLFVRDLADLLQLSPNRVRALLRQRVLPGRRLGRRWVVERDRLLEALADDPHPLSVVGGGS